MARFAVERGAFRGDSRQLAVPANTRLRAMVRLRNSFDPLTPTYRLVVTGASGHHEE